MTDIGDARRALERAEELESDDDFRDRVEEEMSADLVVADAHELDERGQLMMLPIREPLPLTGYLASALTGLTDQQRQLIFHLSDAISQVCLRHGIDVYEPRKAT